MHFPTTVYTEVKGVPTDLASAHLDQGERESIALALALDGLLIDEERGREEARQRGVAVHGTLGVLIKAYHREFITTDQLRFYFEQIEGGADIWISPTLCAVCYKRCWAKLRSGGALWLSEQELEGIGGLKLCGRVIKEGKARGMALVSHEPIGFFGGVDPETGMVVERGHPLEGDCIAGRVLVFPTGKGSTVGSYTLYRLAKKGLAPAAIVNEAADPVVAVGAIIAEIPMVDRVDISDIETGDEVEVEGEEVIVG